MKDFIQKLEVVLKAPDVLTLWPNDKIGEVSARVSFKIMIQDSKLFPKWPENPIELETGTIHTLIVTTAIVSRPQSCTLMASPNFRSLR